MEREKKPVHHVQITEGNRNIIRQILQEHDIQNVRAAPLRIEIRQDYRKPGSLPYKLIQKIFYKKFTVFVSTYFNPTL